MTVKIILADNHSIVRSGLRFQCKDIGYTNIDEVRSSAELMKKLKEKSYSHLILDIVLSDGSSLDVLPNIRRLYPKLNILIFSMHSEVLYGRALIGYGIPNFLSKESEEEEIKIYLRKFLGTKESMKPMLSPQKAAQVEGIFTQRETEVLGYLLQGVDGSVIEQNLNISQSTVATHKRNILRKTATKNLLQLKEWLQLYMSNTK